MRRPRKEWRDGALADLGRAVAYAIEMGCTRAEILTEVDQELAFHENDDEDD